MRPDWVQTKGDQMRCDIYTHHDSANIALMGLKHYFADPAEKQKLIETGTVNTYIFHVRDLYQKMQKIIDLIASSEYSYLLNDD